MTSRKCERGASVATASIIDISAEDSVPLLYNDNDENNNDSNDDNNDSDDNDERERKKEKVKIYHHGIDKKMQARSAKANSSQELSKPNWYTYFSKCDGKKSVGIIFFGTLAILVWDAWMRPPENRLLKPETAAKFLTWVEANPYWGIGAFLIVIAVCVIFLVPVGTPLTMGCGFIYKGVYGWYVGMAVATAVSMVGSGLGAVGCFLLGRYMMRDRVRKWIRKYPLFDAIDTAVSEHGLRIMAMLYLTPVLPLGPVSYMCGSTSMELSTFIIAKIASLPLMLFYVYIGAAAGTLIADADAIEHNSTLIISGIGLSTITIACISNYIRKELMHVLDRHKSGGKKVDEPNDIELASSVPITTTHNDALQRRHVINDPPSEMENTSKGK